MRRLLIVVCALAIFLPAVAMAQSGSAKDLAMRYQKMAAILNTKTISVDFKDTPFEDVVKFFRAATGINIVVDQDIYADTPKEECTVTLNVSELPAGDILDLILRFKNFSRAFRYGVLLITTPDKASGKAFMRMYDVRDLTVPLKDFPGVDIELKGDTENITPIFEDVDEEPKNYSTDDIVSLIQENTGTDSWDVGNCRITIFRGVLIVVQTAKVHREIATLLAHLRATR
ncbi:MAG: hypothetical protein ACYTHM_07505 [Planctomycetota bacterium]|jgi:hypothetical protein